MCMRDTEEGEERERERVREKRVNVREINEKES